MKFKVCLLTLAIALPAYSGVSELKNNATAKRLSQSTDAYTTTSSEPGYQTGGVGDSSWRPSIDLSNAKGSLSAAVAGSPSISLENTTSSNEDISSDISNGSNGSSWASQGNLSVSTSRYTTKTQILNSKLAPLYKITMVARTEHIYSPYKSLPYVTRTYWLHSGESANDSNKQWSSTTTCTVLVEHGGNIRLTNQAGNGRYNNCYITVEALL